MTSYYVDNIIGLDTNDGKTNSTCFKTLNNAIRTAIQDDIIYVNYSDKPYEISEQSILSKNLTIIGEEGAFTKITTAGFTFTKSKIFKNLHFEISGLWNTSGAEKFDFENCIFEGSINDTSKNGFWSNTSNTRLKNVLIKNFSYNVSGGFSVQFYTGTTVENVSVQNCLGVRGYPSNATLKKSIVGNNINIASIDGDYLVTDSIIEGDYGFILPLKNKTLILHDGEYKKWVEAITEDKNAHWSTTSFNPIITEEFLYAGENAIPAMTSDILPSGVASASSIRGSGNEAFRAFNGGIEAGGWHVATGVSGWLKYNFPSPKRIGRYSIGSYLGYPTSAPKDWTFEGSNTGLDGDWVILDKQTNQVGWADNVWKEYTFKNNTLYSMYRINITDNSGYTALAISEMKMFEVTITMTKTMDGMDSLSPLLDRKVTTLEPLPMTDKSEILLGNGEGKLFSKTLDLKKYFDIRQIKVEVK